MVILDLLLAALGSAMALIVLVVVLIQTIYINELPRLADDLPVLLVLAGILAAIGGSAWLAVWARLRDKSWKLYCEAGMLLVSAGGVLAIAQLLEAFG